MIQCGIQLLFGDRFNKNYFEEINYVKALGFDFFQVTFLNGSLRADALLEPREKAIKNALFPIILHVVFDMPDYEKYDEKLLYLLNFLEHKEVILHPIFELEPITNTTPYFFEKKIDKLHTKLSKYGIKLLVENNGIKEYFFNSSSDLKIIFEKYPEIGLILDIAHVNDYEHLKEIVNMRYPECIHIADRHFNVDHEHIPLGEGNLDFDKIFKEIIPNYNNKIILEAINSRNGIEQSKRIMDKLFQ